MSHGHHHGGHSGGGATPHQHEPRDWGAAGGRLELEGEVALPLLREAVDAIADARSVQGGPACILDLGSGPGVASVLLAERFPTAVVTAVDASPELLELAATRARRFGVAGRVVTRVADLGGSLAGVSASGTADVAWAAMVLHHMDSPRDVLIGVRRLLRPGGLIAVVELGDRLHGALPDGFDVGRPGFVDRHAEAVRAALEEHLPPGALSLDWPSLLTDAGFEGVVRRALGIRLGAPLSDAARRCAYDDLRTSALRVPGHLDDGDRELLAGLVDESDPRCVLNRADLTLRIERTMFLAHRI